MSYAGKPSWKKLMVLALASVGLFLLVDRFRVWQRQPFYEEKLKAARLMLRAETVIRDFVQPNGVDVDVRSDPNGTGLIGDQFSIITTDTGDLTSKLTVLNPNFAAAVVEMMKQGGLKEGDTVAVAFSGSMPGANIAVLAAAQTLKLRPLIITSVGASWWGATDPNFTWLDMEKLLYERGVFKHRSFAASIGGGDDVGRGLSKKGRRLLLEAIRRSGAILIHEPTLEASIEKRVSLYQQRADGKPIKAYVNVGGGAASVGSELTAKMIPAGFTAQLLDKNYPVRGVLVRMAERGIPVIHIERIPELARRYGLPLAPVPLPDVGDGPLFVQQRYHLGAVAFALMTLLLLLILVIRTDVSGRLFPQWKGVPKEEML